MQHLLFVGSFFEQECPLRVGLFFCELWEEHFRERVQDGRSRRRIELGPARRLGIAWLVQGIVFFEFVEGTVENPP
jgi:hypothetical protein